MKTILLIFCFGFSAGAQSVLLSWNYPSNDLALSSTNGWPLNFLIRATNQVFNAGTNWPVIYDQSWTNTPITGFDGTNYQFTITNPAPAGQMFFVCTASNIWGESLTSNMVSVPPLPIILHTQILKGP